jgi:hypothetical protein
MYCRDSLSPGSPVTLAPLGPGVHGGTQTTVNGSSFTSVLLQLGIYRVSWSWVGSDWPDVQVGYPPIMLPEINGDQQVWQGNPNTPTILKSANPLAEVEASTDMPKEVRERIAASFARIRPYTA